jgi:hypothetical protein
MKKSTSALTIKTNAKISPEQPLPDQPSDCQEPREKSIPKFNRKTDNKPFSRKKSEA